MPALSVNLQHPLQVKIEKNSQQNLNPNVSEVLYINKIQNTKLCLPLGSHSVF